MDYWLFTMEGAKKTGVGMMKRQHPQPITNYFDIPSVYEYSAKVEKLGGKVMVHKTAVPGMGYFSLILILKKYLRPLGRE
jgi:uncharacterized protein